MSVRIESTAMMALRVLLVDHDWSVDHERSDRLYTMAGRMDLVLNHGEVIITYPDFQDPNRRTTMRLTGWGAVGNVVTIAVQVASMVRVADMARGN